MPAAERRELIVSVATEVFAERGYDGASIDEIARRAGVSAPVVYDHFASKQDLYERLLERTRDELLEVWREHLFTDEPAEVRIPRAIAAWAAYVEEHRDAARMYFRDPTGVPAVQEFHGAIHAQGRAALGAILGREQGNFLDLGLEARVGRPRRFVFLRASNLADSVGNRFALGSVFTVVSEDQITPLRPRTIRIGVHASF